MDNTEVKIDNNSGIEVKSFEFLSNSGYTNIRGLIWIPAGKVRGIVQISHGMSEYIERYDEFARYLAARDILVVGNNHMGHGDSVNTREEFGYFAPRVKGVAKKDKEEYSNSELTVKDLLEVTHMIKKDYPDVQFIMLGHSMGSFLARRYMMEYGEELDGAIIMGTGNQPKALLTTAISVSNIIRTLRGDRHRSKFFYFLMFGSYNKRIKDAKGPFDWVTSDQDKLELYNTDERSGFMFTMNGIDTLLTTIRFIERDENIAKIPKDIKLLLVSGTEDPVGEYGKRVKEVYRIYKAAGIKSIAMKLYDGCRHEILNEVIRPEVYADLAKWIDKVIG